MRERFRLWSRFYLKLLAFCCYWIFEQQQVQSFYVTGWLRNANCKTREEKRGVPTPLLHRKCSLVLKSQQNRKDSAENSSNDGKDDSSELSDGQINASSSESFNFKSAITWIKINFSWQNSLFGFVSGVVLSFSLIFGPILQSTDLANEFASTPFTSASSTATDSEEESLLQPVVLFQNILFNLQRDYIDSINPMALFQSGMKAMLTSLDPYTEFQDLQEAKQMQESVSGKYAGVGMIIADINSKANPSPSSPSEVALPPGNVQVVSAFEGYAFDSGIRPGDIILSINGVDTRRLNSVQVKDLLRGEPNTDVKVTYLRDYSPSNTPSTAATSSSHDNSGKVMETTIRRSSVQLSDIRLATLLGKTEDGIGYINVAGFNGGLGRDFRNAIYLLRTNSMNDLKGLIIDLRNNPGGLLDAAVELASYLLPDNSDIVTSRGKDGQEIVYRSVASPIIPKETKVVVLVNKGSASAAEILAGAIQDSDRGLILGSTSTYGKGLVQKIVPLPYNAALKYTIAKYYTPSGRCIQEIRYTGGRAKASQGSDNGAITLVTADSEEKQGTKETGKNEDDDNTPLYDMPPDDVVEDIFNFNEREASSSSSSPLPGRKKGGVQQYTIPDSERKTFYTKRLHRPVRDGKGIEPDIIFPNSMLLPSPIEAFLYKENLFNEFVNSYLPEKYPQSYDMLRQQLRQAYGEEKTLRNQVIDYYKQLVYNTIMMNAKESMSLPPSSPTTSSSPSSGPLTKLSRFLPSSFVAQKSMEELDNLHQGYFLNNLFNVPSIEQFYVLNHHYDQQQLQETLPLDTPQLSSPSTASSSPSLPVKSVLSDRSSSSSKVSPENVIESTARTPIDARFFFGDNTEDDTPRSDVMITLGKNKILNYQQFREQLFHELKDFLNQKIQASTSSSSSPSSPSSPAMQYANLLKKEFSSFRNLFYYFPSLSSIIDEELSEEIIPKINEYMAKDLINQKDEIVDTIETVLLNKELPNRLMSYYQLQHDPQLSVAMRLLSSDTSKGSNGEGLVPVQLIRKGGLTYYKALPEAIKGKDQGGLSRQMNQRNIKNNNKDRSIEKGFVSYDSLLSSPETR